MQVLELMLGLLYLVPVQSLASHAHISHASSEHCFVLCNVKSCQQCNMRGVPCCRDLAECDMD